MTPSSTWWISAWLDHFMGAMSTATLAFERGETALLDEAIERFRVGLASAAELNLVPQWWCHRLAIHLVGDLWATSFHERLPLAPRPRKRKPLVDLLCIPPTVHRHALPPRPWQIDLWPSQLDAAARALDVSDNMVVSLPDERGQDTCGRTVHPCLSREWKKSGVRHTVEGAVRPDGGYLAADLSALRKDRFEPLRRDRRERNRPGLPPRKRHHSRHAGEARLRPAERPRHSGDHVGLVVLDEGHMIGLTEREVRYEVQIQRLLRRTDAPLRRIVCLSAILPEGEQLEDFTAWLTDDRPDGLVTKYLLPHASTLRRGHLRAATMDGSISPLMASTRGSKTS